MTHINQTDANLYYERADRHAALFLTNREKKEKCTIALSAHSTKYATVLQVSVLHTIPAIIAIPCHAAAGVLEGLILAPLFRAMAAGVLTDESIIYAVGYFPILIFLGTTMMIGRAFHRSDFRFDPLIPNKIRANWIELTQGVAIGLAYVFMLVQLTETSRALLGQKGRAAEVILFVGVFELLLGYLAISGWQFVYAHLKLSYLKYELTQKEAAILFHAGRCERLYDYYRQAAAYVILTENPRYTVKINNRIEEVIAFGKVKTQFEMDFN